ncbi:MAG: bifunctional DNA primase/polymerase [Actinomycetota bacterium]|nr:bifunctional DNA primase/polymerase [Actinomycetota bacterium]
MLGAALRYAGRGWPVFWLGRTKRPIANCPACPKREDPAAHDPASCGHLTCHGFYAATTSPDRITAARRRVPGGVLAIRTGTVSGLAVVDIDPRNGGAIDTALMSPTATVATGGGGWHLFYRHPGVPLPPELPGHPGVDIKADGGYAVAPPSVHPGTGRPYQWAGHWTVNEMPPALRAALAVPAPEPAREHARPAPRAALAAAPAAGGISSPPALLAACLDAVARAPKGHRRHALYGAARGVWRIIAAAAITEQDGRAALTAAGLAAEQTPRDIAAAINGGFAAEQAAQTTTKGAAA